MQAVKDEVRAEIRTREQKCKRTRSDTGTCDNAASTGKDALSHRSGATPVGPSSLRNRAESVTDAPPASTFHDPNNAAALATYNPDVEPRTPPPVKAPAVPIAPNRGLGLYVQHQVLAEAARLNALLARASLPTPLPCPYKHPPARVPCRHCTADLSVREWHACPARPALSPDTAGAEIMPPSGRASRIVYETPPAANVRTPRWPDESLRRRWMADPAQAEAVGLGRAPSSSAARDERVADAAAVRLGLHSLPPLPAWVPPRAVSRLYAPPPAAPEAWGWFIPRADDVFGSGHVTRLVDELEAEISHAAVRPSSIVVRHEQATPWL
jgi:hypothetical protein